MRKKLPNKPTIKIDKPIKENEYAYCQCLVNNLIEVSICSHLSENDILAKVSKRVKNINTIYIRVLQVWTKLN